jgi:peptidoglycan-associated lipoprotein
VNATTIRPEAGALDEQPAIDITATTIHAGVRDLVDGGLEYDIVAWRIPNVSRCEVKPHGIFGRGQPKRFREESMSRFAMSVTLVLMVTGGAFTQRDADACGVKLAIKSGRHPHPKREPEKTGDRPVVAQRQTREPVAVGPQNNAPRRVVEAKPVVTTPTPVVVNEPTPVRTVTSIEPAKTTVVDKPVVVVKKPTVTEKRVDDKPAEEKPAVVEKKPVEKPAVVEKKPVVAVTTQGKRTPEIKKPVPTPTPVATSSEFVAEAFFSLGGSALTPYATNSLKKTAKWLSANSGVNITIEGHADTTGTPDLNLALGTRRAEAVSAFLVAEGIDASRIETTSLGDTKPKYLPGTDGRNRRVVITKK